MTTFTIKQKPIEFKTHELGDIFQAPSGCDYYILARTGMDPKIKGGIQINLINLKNGRRWSIPVVIYDTSKITNEKLIELFGEGEVWQNWKKLSNVVISGEVKS